jgi:ABC-type lipoprotein export system ATPase subunit
MSDRGLECCKLQFTRRGPDGSDRIVLKNLDVRFSPGQSALISGATGAGKTTLLSLLAGMQKPTQGEVLSDGEPVSRYSAMHRDRWRRRVGFVFQQARFLSGCTVLENVILPLVPRKMPGDAMRTLARQALSFCAVSGMESELVESLSDGQRQRVSLARAIVGDPDFLFLDEPTAHQDDEGVEMVLRVTGQSRDRDGVVVVVAHDPRLDQSGGFDRRWQLCDAVLAEVP